MLHICNILIYTLRRFKGSGLCSGCFFYETLQQHGYKTIRIKLWSHGLLYHGLHQTELPLNLSKITIWKYHNIFYIFFKCMYVYFLFGTLLTKWLDRFEREPNCLWIRRNCESVIHGCIIFIRLWVFKFI